MTNKIKMQPVARVVEMLVRETNIIEMPARLRALVLPAVERAIHMEPEHDVM